MENVTGLSIKPKTWTIYQKQSQSYAIMNIMMKSKSNRILIISMILVVFVILITLLITWIYRRELNLYGCETIYGDGYSMGIDPYPVPIGNTCD